jgi:transposase
LLVELEGLLALTEGLVEVAEFVVGNGEVASVVGAVGFGVGEALADGVNRFPTAGHLASWAGTCPGSNESAGRIKSTHTRPGTPYLKGALGVAAMSAARNKDTYLSAKYRRIASRRGPLKAIVAIEHALLTAIWNMITNNVPYHEPGADFYTRLHPDKTK